MFNRSEKELLGHNNQYLPKIVSVFAEVPFAASYFLDFCCNISSFCVEKSILEKLQLMNSRGAQLEFK
jgi:hypothetical protein